MATENVNSHLTSGRLLARNTVWNLVGQILPMIVGVVAIPRIIRGIGVERFGVLSLAWVMVGYFSLFDLGIGRALTKLVADRLGASEEGSMASLVWTSLALMFGLGVIGSVVTVSVSPLLVHRLLKVPVALQTETLYSFYVLAASIPIVTVTAGFRGVLEALQRFRLVNLIKTPMGVVFFVAPLLVFPFSHGLVPVIAALVLGRLLGCGAYYWACLETDPSLRYGHFFDAAFLLPLIRFGGWMTVNNVVGPLMFSFDRFLVGAVLSLSAVAYYTTPVDMIVRLTVIPNAVVGVLFPAFAMSLSQDPDRTGILLSRALKYIFLLIFPIVLVTVTFAPEILSVWLSPTFSAQGSAVLRWAAVGLFFNSLSLLPFVLIQSAGRPDITAWMLIAELPFYAVALWLLTRRLGVEGAAVAWSARLGVEAVILFLIAQRTLPQISSYLPKLSAAALGALALLWCSCFPVEVGSKLGFLCVVMLIFGLIAWYWAFTPAERQFVIGARAELPIRKSSSLG